MGILFHFLLAASFYENLERDSQLYRSVATSQVYAQQTAKALPPSSEAQTLECLCKASVWYFAACAPSKESEWNDLANLGIEALDIPPSENAAAQS